MLHIGQSVTYSIIKPICNGYGIHQKVSSSVISCFVKMLIYMVLILLTVGQGIYCADATKINLQVVNLCQYECENIHK